MSELISPEPLTDDQLHQMLVAEDPESKWPVHLTHTSELEADYRTWLATECFHAETQLTKTITKTGSPYFGMRCVICGERKGPWLPAKTIKEPELVPIAKSEGPAEFDRLRRQQWRDTKQAHYLNQSNHEDTEYQKYLQTPKWKALSAKVILRAKGVCEGCGERPAAQAHHISYAHKFDEFLWELKAVCRPCHIRVHPEKNGGLK